MKLSSIDLLKGAAYSSALAFSLAATAASAQVAEERIAGNAGQAETEMTAEAEPDAGALGEPEPDVGVFEEPAGGLEETPGAGAAGDALENSEDLENRAVLTDAGEAIGEVDEVLSGADGKTYLLVESGGFLDIGDNEFIVPLADARVTENAIIVSGAMLGEQEIETSALGAESAAEATAELEEAETGLFGELQPDVGALEDPEADVGAFEEPESDAFEESGAGLQ